ncbi:MAG TPA: PSD1 and planctomycete cytochrome C domain-containing protein [Pirellulales bacterium]|nr:PSD1 and planctomycete cytochrome C domain-containing protein [Pirellulales bacterium]
MLRTSLLPAALVLFASIATVRAETPSAADVEFFETKVRPVLVARCYKCHSQEAENLRGSLLLDSQPGWMAGGDSGPAIVPGDPAASLLVKALQYDGDVQMPPEGKLPDAEIATLTEWVKRGAPDPRATKPTGKAKRTINLAEERKHWAFQPLAPQVTPYVADPSWCRTPVDRFIIARLNDKQLAPNAAADKRTLIRRAYLDLLGLPPKPEEVEAFVADLSPDAYDRLVERLLDSPHYGERWARHWLDLARFAESHGFEHDYDRLSAYHYRDFVIKALNQDLPYDTFVKWQIAGDEYEPENPLALMATGFLAAGVHSTQITKNQVEKERYDELDDMSATIGSSMLGLTIGCARCHDHKFDPIPTADYYRLLSTFTTAVRSEVDLNLDRANYEAALATFNREHAPLAEALAQYEAQDLPIHFDAWLVNRSAPHAAAGGGSSTANVPVTGAATTWQILEITDAKSEAGVPLAPLEDGSLLAGGKAADKDTYTFVARTHQRNITGIRLEALVDDTLPKHGPGRAANGNFALSDVQITAAPQGSEKDAAPVKLAAARATFEQPNLPVAAAIDEDKKSAWAVDGQIGKDQAAAVEFAAPVGFDSGTVFTITLRFENNAGHSIGRPRIALTTSPTPPALDAPSERQNAAEIAALLAQPGAADAKAREAMLRWYRPLDDGWRERNRSVLEHSAKAPQPTLTKVLITSEGLPAVRLHTQGDDFLKETHFLERGDPNRKKDVATQSFLQVLMTSADGERAWQTPPPAGWRTSYRRRALAEWITDREHGAGTLLARVIVNRLWQHHLGRGIVATPSDFGTQGARPTHPELLDYLAAELIANDWRLKPIHRLIMQSAVYMQGSAADESRAKIDPDNNLLWRRPRARLEAEVIRDCILAAGGMLDERMFGPGTLDDNQLRRSIYFTVKRSKLVPMMMLFDAPDGLQAISARSSTTIAPQALLLLNNRQVREAARHFAARVTDPAAADSDSWTEPIRRAYLIALSRTPSDAEVADAVQFLDEQSQLYAADGKADRRLAALADFCQVLFGLNEFVYAD